MVIVVLLTGTLYVQQEALLPQDTAQAVPVETPVQKHGILAGMG
jgi:hypothetical protein